MQCTHFVHLLLDAKPGTRVSLEVLEDVATESSDGDTDAIQLKSAQKTNPIANRSIELWKTIRNWINSVKAGELAVEETNFRIRLGRKRGGPICEAFANASTRGEAAIAIKNAKSDFFTAGGRVRSGVPNELADILKEVFSDGRVELLTKIITRFTLSFGTGHAYEELLAGIKTKFIDDDLAEDVLLRGLGWVKKEIDNAIENDKPPSIAVDDFRVELTSFRNRLRGRDFLPSFGGPPSLDEIELNRLRVFVRQLEFVQFAQDRILGAITDFLNARTNRVEYAKRGYANSDRFKEFENALRAIWMNYRDEIELDETEEKEKRGRRLALKCLRTKQTLQGINAPDHFVRGCFHTLADVPTIGWHPDYSRLLNDEED